MQNFKQAITQRAYFPLVLNGMNSFKIGMEVGVADGRFSELFLKHIAKNFTWYMIEPFPTKYLQQRLDASCRHNLSWCKRNIGNGVQYIHKKGFSLDADVLNELSGIKFDFIYLDGAHDYVNVKKEMVAYWPLLRSGGILAGHDYCKSSHVQKVPVIGCRTRSDCKAVPICGEYTSYGKMFKRQRKVADQSGVVRAVQEWLLETDSSLVLRHTLENFTRASLLAHNVQFDLAITNTRNPSWYFMKP